MLINNFNGDSDTTYLLLTQVTGIHEYNYDFSATYNNCGVPSTLSSAVSTVCKPLSCIHAHLNLCLICVSKHLANFIKCVASGLYYFTLPSFLRYACVQFVHFSNV